MKNNEFIVRKVSTESLIDILNDLYSRGVNYVDIYAVYEEEDRDTLGFAFCKEYMADDYKQVFDNIDTAFDNVSEEESSENKIKVKFSDDDLNQLL